MYDQFPELAASLNDLSERFSLLKGELGNLALRLTRLSESLITDDADYPITPQLQEGVGTDRPGRLTRPVAYTLNRQEKPESPNSSHQPNAQPAASDPGEWAGRPKTTYVVSRRYDPRSGNPTKNTIPCRGTEAQEIIDRFEARIKHARAELLRLFPSEEQGLDTASLDDYAGRLGIRPAKTIYLPPEGFEEFHHTSARLTGFRRLDSTTIEGAYNKVLDLIVVRRDPKLEELNGPVITLSTAMHERTHGAKKSRLFGITSNCPPPLENIVLSSYTWGLSRWISYPNQGTYKKLGDFFDEGLAEHTATGYILSATGRETGLLPESVPYIYKNVGGTLIKIPPIFARLNKEGVRCLSSTSGLPAMAISSLMSRDPRIPRLLLHDQQNHNGLVPPGLSQYAIDAIGGPSFYRQLDRLQLNWDDFATGYGLVDLVLKWSH